MAIVALAVSVLLNAALAVALFVSYKRIVDRLNALDVTFAARIESRFTQPTETLKLFPSFASGLPEMDTVGAWAAEREAMGLPVDDEELETQRRMWAAEAQA